MEGKSFASDNHEVKPQPDEVEALAIAMHASVRGNSIGWSDILFDDRMKEWWRTIARAGLAYLKSKNLLANGGRFYTDEELGDIVTTSFRQGQDSLKEQDWKSPEEIKQIKRETAFEALRLVCSEDYTIRLIKRMGLEEDNA